jgi:hypothetical protein
MVVSFLKLLSITMGSQMNGTTRSITVSSDRLGFGVLDLAAAYGLSPAFVRLEEKRGRLRGIRLGRRVIFTREAVADWLARSAEVDAR